MPKTLNRATVHRTPSRPRAYAWFLTYCTLFVAVGFFFVLLGLLIAAGVLERGQTGTLQQGIAYVLFGLLIAGPYGAPFFLKRTPATWTYDLVLIAVGMSTTLLVAIGLPLYIFWRRDDMRAYFGRR